MSNLTKHLVRRTYELLMADTPELQCRNPHAPFVVFMGIAKGSGREYSLQEFLSFRESQAVL